MLAARIHDLLKIDAERFLHTRPSAPEWVAESLRRAPFVVVRRGPISAQAIPTGIRGTQRNERWPATCHPDIVRSVLTPHDLLRRMTAGASTAAPSLRSLSLLAHRWQALTLQWGPAGSVGFELATGHPVIKPTSDLDIVIYAPQRITQPEAQHLHATAQGLPTAVDIRVETPHCGFSLTEYAAAHPQTPILLRLASGTVLGTNPWPAANPPPAAALSPGAGPQTWPTP